MKSCRLSALYGVCFETLAVPATMLHFTLFNNVRSMCWTDGGKSDRWENDLKSVDVYSEEEINQGGPKT